MYNADRKRRFNELETHAENLRVRKQAVFNARASIQTPVDTNLLPRPNVPLTHTALGLTAGTNAGAGGNGNSGSGSGGSGNGGSGSGEAVEVGVTR